MFRVRVEACELIIVESSLLSSFKVLWWLYSPLLILGCWSMENWRLRMLYHLILTESQSKSAMLIWVEPTQMVSSMVQMVTCRVLVDSFVLGTATGKVSPMTTGFSLPLSAWTAWVVKDQLLGDTDGTRDTFKYLKKIYIKRKDVAKVNKNVLKLSKSGQIWSNIAQITPNLDQNKAKI